MKNQEITNKLTKKKIRFIDVAPAIKKEIAAELGCTVDTVNNALNLTYPTYGEQPDSRTPKSGGCVNKNWSYGNLRS